MGIREFDNIRISDMSLLLTRETAPERYYPLIPHVQELVQNLLRCGIEDKYQLLSRFESAPEQLENSLNTERTTLSLLCALLHLYDFKERRLAELKTIGPTALEVLADYGIRRSSDYLHFCLKNGVQKSVKSFGVCREVAERLITYCDLMRLPGVKEIRAELYYDCGIRTVADFSVWEAVKLREKAAQCISAANSSKTIPLMKELKTQVALAKVLPRLSFNE